MQRNVRFFSILFIKETKTYILSLILAKFFCHE